MSASIASFASSSDDSGTTTVSGSSCALCSSVFDGVPRSLPALARADKLLGRLARGGIDVAPVVAGDDSVGARLMALVVEARAEEVDPEAALRDTLADLTVRVSAAEAADRRP